MKKIVFIESAQNFGGARKAVIDMALSLQERHKVSVIDLVGSCTPFIEACKSANLDLRILMENQDPVFIKSASTKLKRILGLIRFIPFLIKAGKLIDKNCKDYDYICVSGFRPLLCMLFYRPRAKVVFFAHGWYKRGLLPRWNKWLLKHRVDKIVCVSEATRHALLNMGVADLSQMYVVHNAIDENKITNNVAEIPDSDNKIKLLHCGGFLPSKGQHISLEIATELKKRNIPFKLIYTGIIYKGSLSQSYLEKLKHDVSRLNLDNDVMFVVNKNNVYDYMRACDVLIHPSETEGFPLVVMEAQIMKKVAIANPVGGIIDMILDGYTGFLPQFNNVIQYVEIIESLRNDEELYNRVSETGYKLAKLCFNQEKQRADLNRVFIG